MLICRNPPGSGSCSARFESTSCGLPPSHLLSDCSGFEARRKESWQGCSAFAEECGRRMADRRPQRCSGKSRHCSDQCRTKKGLQRYEAPSRKKLAFDLSGVTAYLHQTSARWKVQRMHVPWMERPSHRGPRLLHRMTAGNIHAASWRKIEAPAEPVQTPSSLPHGSSDSCCRAIREEYPSLLTRRSLCNGRPSSERWCQLSQPPRSCYRPWERQAALRGPKW